jgi:DNA-3-methyladenine glycosylase II
MKAVLKKIGPFTLKLERNRLQALIRSIVSQQISTAAARTILTRLQEATGGHPFSTAAIAAMNVDSLREIGISRQKAGYLLDLCHHVESGELNLNQLHRLDDEAVIETLTQVKGIGRWTAQMFLIFSLGRLDIVAPDDHGLKTAQMRLYGLEALPNKETFFEIAELWRPFASVASWYCWRSLELNLTRDTMQI